MTVPSRVDKLHIVVYADETFQWKMQPMALNNCVWTIKIEVVKMVMESILLSWRRLPLGNYVAKARKLLKASFSWLATGSLTCEVLRIL